MFQNLYKQGVDRNERQELRRKELLRQQKLKRLEQQDELRPSDEEPEQKRGRQQNHKKQKYTSIENINLQLSEWLKEKPENLDDWLLVPCPKGQRCLVVAAKGQTKMFSKNKKYRMTFSSILPGGGLNSTNNNSCILDCIYNVDMDKFFVLDAIHFFVPLMDCDTEFRLFWLKSKFDEINDLEEECNIENLKKFELLNNYDMSNEERMAMALQRYPIWPNNEPELDGFLFYHKQSHYVCGTTPLVCWLFPFMIPDILNLPVSREYKTPCNYKAENPWLYIDEFDKQMSLKQLRKTKKKTELMSYELCGELETNIKEESFTELETNMEDVDEVEQENIAMEDWSKIYTTTILTS
ncbi:snurportin-1 [Cochliomyia hominivorax]